MESVLVFTKEVPPDELSLHRRGEREGGNWLGV